jgi:hypothetical protein
MYIQNVCMQKAVAVAVHYVRVPTDRVHHNQHAAGGGRRIRRQPNVATLRQKMTTTLIIARPSPAFRLHTFVKPQASKCAHNCPGHGHGHIIDHSSNSNT